MKSKLSCSVKSVSRAVSALRSAGVQVRRGKIQRDKYVFFVHSKREKTALSALKSRGIECRVEESGGAEYLKKRLALNAGALLAAVFAVIICAVCSLFVFKVEVYCENATTAALITQFLDENRGKAKSGIDVRIVTPGIPDKKLVFLLTQSYYDKLIQSGVRIFEFKPGFLHAKSFVCDDEIATVGTINLDFRSLYLHFECGVWMYRTEAVLQIKEDALAIFRECREITWKDCEEKSLGKRLIQSVLRLFAPLL